MSSPPRLPSSSGSPTQVRQGLVPFLGHLFRAVRPRQWLKNVLVAAAPFIAGRLGETDVLFATLATFATWCVVSSAIYLINDIVDRDADRANPARSHRPFAAGHLTPRVGLAIAVFLLVSAIPLAGLFIGAGTAGLLAAYVVLQVCYSLWLKHEPVIDIGVVSSGFVFRSIAGGVATGIAISPWFLLVASTGSLFMVAGKRASEAVATPEGGDPTRPVLERYSESFLRFVWTMSAGLTLLTYAMWAIEGRSVGRSWWMEATIIPVALGMLRYAMAIDAGRAGDPEDVVLADRMLLALGAAFVILIVIGIRGG